MNREVLLQYIYDFGWDKALSIFHLTESKADNILNPKVSRIVTEYSKKVKPKKDIDIDKATVIWSIVSTHYKELYNKFVSYQKFQINVRSETKEDKFHNALIKITENLERFEYISDDYTLSYIYSRLFYENKTDKKDDIRLKNAIQFTTFNTLEYVFTDGSI